MEEELHVALDEVESESMRGTSMFEAKDSEAANLRARVSANEAEISRMVSELEGAQTQLQERTAAAEAAKVLPCTGLLVAWEVTCNAIMILLPGGSQRLLMLMLLASHCLLDYSPVTCK